MRIIFLLILLFCCYNCQPILGNLTTISRFINQIEWLDENNIFIVTSTSQLWKSKDNGMSWNELSNQMPFIGESIRYFRTSPDKKTIAITTRNYVFLSDNLGETWSQVNAGGSFYWRFHPSISGYALIFNVVGCTGSPECYYQLLSTTDNGKTFKKIDTYVQPYFSWGDAGTNNVPPSRVYWCAHQKKSGIQANNYDDINYYYSDDFGATKNLILSNGVAFEIHHPFTFILKYESGTDFGLYVSKDFVHSFRKSQFPFRDELQENEFNILDTSTGAAYVSVNHGTSQSVWENLYISNSLGNMYSISLDYIHRGPYGITDFSIFRGLEGIYIANSMKVSEINSKNPLLSSYITFDNGAWWIQLNIPEKDSNNQPIICAGAQCRLNLHYVSSWFSNSFGPFYSTPNAIGLIIATGNVGEFLSFESSNVNTYFSRDAGLTWMEIKKGSSIYEIGDYGSLIVLADNINPTDSVMYSFDQGLTWNTITVFPEKYLVENIIIHSDTKFSFVVIGLDNNMNTKLVALDLSKIHLRECTDSDYEEWTPNDGRTDEKCIMGRTMVYWRKKRDAKCNNPSNLQHLKSSTNCRCEIRDWECDFGYEQGDEEGDCEPQAGISTVPEYCPPGTFYNKTNGHRKVAGNTCEGGVTYGVVLTPCPNVVPTSKPNDKSIGSTLILMITFFVTLLVVVSLIVITKSKNLREKIFPCVQFPSWWTGEKPVKFTLEDDIFDDQEENLLDSNKYESNDPKIGESKVPKLENFTANINDILDQNKDDDDDL